MPQLVNPEIMWLGQFDARVLAMAQVKDEVDGLRNKNQLPQDMDDQLLKFDTLEAAREEKLNHIRDVMAVREDAMRKATERRDMPGQEEVIVYKKGLRTRAKPLRAKKGKKEDEFASDPDRQFDPSEIKAKNVLKGLSPEAVDAVNDVVVQLTELTQQIMAAKSADELLFSPNELMEEIWTPLIREGLIPEPIVPMAMSRIEKLWAGANASYHKRMVEFNQKNKLSEGEEYAKLGLEIAADLTGAAADVVAGVLGAVGAVQQTKDTVALAMTVAKNGIALGSRYFDKDIEKASDVVNKMVSSLITIGITQQTGNATAAKATSALFSSAFKAAVSGPVIAKFLCESPPNVQQAFKTLGAGVASSFACFDDSTTNGQWASIGTMVGAGIVALGNGGLIAAELKKPKPDTAKVLKLLSDGVAQVAGASLKFGAKRLTDPELKELGNQSKAIKQQLAASGLSEENKKTLTDQLTDINNQIRYNTPDSTGADTTGAAIGKILEGTLKKMQDPDFLKAAEEKKKAASKTVADEELKLVRDQIDAQMNALFAGEDESVNPAVQDVYSIDRMMQQLEADKATVELAKQVINAVGGVAAQLVPALGGPIKAKDFALNLVAAVMRHRKMEEWSAHVSDGKRAVSPTVSAFLAQVDELKHQLTNDIINCAFDLAQACTATASIAFPAADAGTKILSGARAIKDVIYEKIIKKAKLARAWSRYKAVHDHPDTHSLTAVRKSIRSNPTLAKYAIAYGALEMNDPFALEALRQLGLNDMVLANKDTDVAKVAAYLEKQFSDDIVVQGVLTEFVPASGPALAPATWEKNKKAAEKNHKWLNQGTAAIDKGLINLEAAEAELKRTPDSETALKAAITQGETLVQALTSYRPLNDQKEPHAEVAAYIQDLAAEAQKKVAGFQKTLTEKAQKNAIEKKLQTDRRDQADAGMRAIAIGLQSLKATKAEDPTFGTFVNAGDGVTLLTTLKACSTASFYLAEPVSVLEDVFTVIRQQLVPDAKKLRERLILEVEACQTALDEQKKTAQDELAKLP
jgi:hypothetical protein